MLKKYYTSQQVRDRYKISVQTLHNWRKTGKIAYHVLPSGRYEYELPQDDASDTKKHVVYARVSTTHQKEDLQRQQSLLSDYIVTNGNIVGDIYADIASGMNANRKEFNRLITDCLAGNIDTVYITYKDRMVRFGFDYFVTIFAQVGVDIVVVNATGEQDYQSELQDDLIAIIHHFSMKMYAKRRQQLKVIKQDLLKPIENDEQ